MKLDLHALRMFVIGVAFGTHLTALEAHSLMPLWTAPISTGIMFIVYIFTKLYEEEPKDKDR